LQITTNHKGRHFHLLNKGREGECQTTQQKEEASSKEKRQRKKRGRMEKSHTTPSPEEGLFAPLGLDLHLDYKIKAYS